MWRSRPTSETIAYGYDRFGRTTQAGALGYGCDQNSNRLALTYPDGVVATYTFVFAAREATLALDAGSGAQNVVSTASYLPFSTLETYGYLSNGSGNTAILTQAGTRTYTTGPAGHVTAINAGGNPIDLAVDAEGRVAGFARSLASAQTSMSYDGRSFLRRSEELLGGGPDVGFTEPTYSSGGLLHALRRQLAPAAPEERVSVFHFAGRPIAQLRQVTGGAASWMFLSADHLGTPAMATGPAGEVVWHGPFEPFGEDAFRGSAQSAQASGVFLRFPGQWEDETWEEATLGALSYYNVHRWYGVGVGRYWRVDPLGLRVTDNLYSYAFSTPSSRVDPLGLASFMCRRPLGNTNPEPGDTRNGPDIALNPVFHQYICIVSGPTITCGGQTPDPPAAFGAGGATRPDEDRFDPSRCQEVREDDDCVEDCLRRRFAQPRPFYGIVGPGTNCQEWADENLASCLAQCSQQPRPFCELHPAVCAEMLENDPR